MDEFELIARYFLPLQGEDPDLLVGNGDDGAVFKLGAERVVVVVDTLVAGVHFPAHISARDIGYRAGAVNLSDIAAMGARPRYATLALTLPEAAPAWLAAFSTGLGEALKAAGTRLIGGDTTRGPLTITLQIIGCIDGAPLTRSGAREGDLVCVSGTLGDACAGLALCAEPPANSNQRWLVERFLRPSARLKLGQALNPLVHAAIDISDGLLADLGHVMQASACRAELNVAALPLSDALLETVGRARAIEYALSGGDDYELAFAIPPAALTAASAMAAEMGLALTVIGRVLSGSGVAALDSNGVDIHPARSGYRHFR